MRGGKNVDLTTYVPSTHRLIVKCKNNPLGFGQGHVTHL